MVSLFSAVFVLYVALRLVLPLPVSAQAKLLCCLVLALAGAKFFFFSYLTGSLSSPEAPRPVLLAANWLFVALFLLFAFVLIKDAVLTLFWLGHNLFGLPRPGPATRLPAAAALSFLALVLSGLGLWQAVKLPEVKTLEIALPGLAPELDGLTVVQLSDLHISRLLPRDRTEALAAAVNALTPDLIVITGDLADGRAETRLRDAAPLAGLKAAHGVYYCVGNHEYYSDFRDWRAVWEKLGVKLLYNEHAALDIKGRRLILAGVADPAGAGPRFNLAGPDLRAALEGAPGEGPVILLDHRPGSAPDGALAGVDLQLSGHTHGGMIWGLDRLVARFNGGYVRGLYQVGPMKLYVSPGAGLWNGFPVRLGVGSEITRFVLRSAPA